MVVELDPVVVLVLDIGVWVIGGVAIGWYHAALPIGQATFFKHLQQNV